MNEIATGLGWMLITICGGLTALIVLLLISAAIDNAWKFIKIRVKKIYQVCPRCGKKKWGKFPEASQYGSQPIEILNLLRGSGKHNYCVSIRFFDQGHEYCAENVTNDSKIHVVSCERDESWTFDDIMDFEAWIFDK